MKKFISILLTVCLLVISMVPAVAVEYNSEAAFQMGDANLDGRVTVKDATIIQKHIAMFLRLSEEQMKLADVDENGTVNVIDATMIQKRIALLIKFPCEVEGGEDELPVTTPDETIPDTTENTTSTTENVTEPSTTENVTEPTTTEVNTEKPTNPDVDPTEVPTSIPDVTETEPTIPTLPTDPTENTTDNVGTDPTEPTTSETYPTEEPSNPTTLPTDTTEPDNSETTEPTTETEPTTSETEPTTSGTEPTEPAKPDATDFKPIDPIEGDIVTAEMMWKIEEGFLKLVNEERARAGYKPYVRVKALDDAAQIRSEEIIELYSHDRPNGGDYETAINPNDYNLGSVAENIHIVYSVDFYNNFKFTGTDEELEYVYATFFMDFCNSKGHYANLMLESFEDVGIGISYYWNELRNVPMFTISHIFAETNPWG